MRSFTFDSQDAERLDTMMSFLMVQGAHLVSMIQTVKSWSMCLCTHIVCQMFCDAHIHICFVRHTCKCVYTAAEHVTHKTVQISTNLTESCTYQAIKCLNNKRPFFKHTMIIGSNVARLEAP